MSGRYDRQTLLPWIGPEGQQKLSRASVAVVGLGAVGSVAAAYLARAGVGRMVLVDRDHVEETNLQRQVLYTEEDCRRNLPKAEAARRALTTVRSDLKVETYNADLDPELALALAGESDLIMDGTDNFETRYLLNDAAVSTGTPWIYAGAVSSYGTLLVVRPGETACLRCLFPDLPPPGSAPTCDTAGVLGPAAGAVAAVQAGEAIKLLAGRPDLCPPTLLTLDLLTLALARVQATRREDCACCGERRFDYLEERTGAGTHRVCGRDGILVLAPKGSRLDLDGLAARLEKHGPVFVNPYLLKTEWEGHPVTLYPDGRALIQKTDDPARARALYARYLGS